MEAFTIDINADVGEGVGNESRLLPLISSCNIACGGHAGDKESMKQVVRLAIDNKVKIGAHPSFPDKTNFGRDVMNISNTALYTTVKAQIRELMNIVREEHALLHHVKPHGALYNLAAKDQKTAEVIVEVMKRFHQPLKLYVPYGSVIADVAQKDNIRITYEAFADRNYNEDLSLVSRKLPNALITDSDEMFAHVHNMVVHKKVRSINGVEIPIKASTFCIHGDNPRALELASKLTENLSQYGIGIK
jgi:UPF0271 protein